MDIHTTEMSGQWDSPGQLGIISEQPVIPRTEAELRRLIDHLGNPDAMAQWLAGILTEEERKDGEAKTPVVGRDRQDTGRGQIPREEAKGDKRVPAGEQGSLFHPDAG